MKSLRIPLLVLGAALGAILAIWLINDRRIPTLRLSHTVGRGSEVDIEWIRLR